MYKVNQNSIVLRKRHYGNSCLIDLISHFLREMNNLMGQKLFYLINRGPLVQNFVFPWGLVNVSLNHRLKLNLLARKNFFNKNLTKFLVQYYKIRAKNLTSHSI